jgi:hypothetical protein
MRRVWTAALVATLLAAAACGIKLFNNMTTVPQAGTDYADWAPSADAVAQSVAAEKDDWARAAKFAEMFQRRFRDHSPAVAVGLHLKPGIPGIILFPARMEPWEMNRIAYMAWSEAKHDLGNSLDIDIYRTFIGIPAIRIGQLRAARDTPDRVLVDYRYDEPNTPIAELLARQPGYHAMRAPESRSLGVQSRR